MPTSLKVSQCCIQNASNLYVNLLLVQEWNIYNLAMNYIIFNLHILKSCPHCLSNDTHLTLQALCTNAVLMFSRWTKQKQQHTHTQTVILQMLKMSLTLFLYCFSGRTGCHCTSFFSKFSRRHVGGIISGPRPVKIKTVWFMRFLMHRDQRPVMIHGNSYPFLRCKTVYKLN